MKKKQKAQKCTGEHQKGILEAERSLRKYFKKISSRDLLEAWSILENADEEEWNELLSIEVQKDLARKEMARRGIREPQLELFEESTHMVAANGHQEMAQPAVM